MSSVNFNPRSREGSDRDIIKSFQILKDFNPRSREGSDDVLLDFLAEFRISIHAPAKGATNVQWPEPPFPGFQSTLPRRERLHAVDSVSVYLQFQSTLPRRERLLLQHFGQGIQAISIHAPAKGATLRTAFHLPHT